jgi:hypothetical protein
MRYRAQDNAGDYIFGRGPAQFLVDSPESVAQAAKTRLELFVGDWFLDAAEGTPYRSDILGNNTADLFDAAITSRILDTPGVAAITDYASTVDPATRQLRVVVKIATVFGVAAGVTISTGTDVNGGAPFYVVTGYVDDGFVI